MEGEMLYGPAYLRMAFSYFFSVSSFGAFFLFPLFVLDRGGSKVDVGVFMGVFVLSAVLCRPWVSGMIDRVGRKKSFTVGSVIMTVLPLSYLLFDGGLHRYYTLLLVVRLVHGVGLAIIVTAALTYIGDMVPVTRLNEGIGIFGVTGLAGNAVGPVLAEIVINHFGFSAYFLCASLLALVGLIGHLPLPENFVPPPHKPSRSFVGLMKQRRTLAVVFVALLFGVGLSASGTFVTPYAKERELTFISLYYIFYSSAAILTRFFGSRFADRIGEKRVIPHSLLLVGAGYLILLFAGRTWILALSGLVTGCGHGFLFPSINALAIRNEPPEIRSKATGIFTGSIDAGAFAGSISLGYTAELAGFRVLFLTSALAFLLGWGLWRMKVLKPSRSGLH